MKTASALIYAGMDVVKRMREIGREKALKDMVLRAILSTGAAQEAATKVMLDLVTKDKEFVNEEVETTLNAVDLYWSFKRVPIVMQVRNVVSPSYAVVYGIGLITHLPWKFKKAGFSRPDLTSALRSEHREDILIGNGLMADLIQHEWAVGLVNFSDNPTPFNGYLIGEPQVINPYEESP